MVSSKLTHPSNRPFVLLSAALLLQTGGALTAASAGDAKAQARELLSQTAAVRSVAVQSSALTAEDRSPADPQAQARRILLGAPSAGDEAQAAATRYAESTSTAAVVDRDHRSARTDAQEMARRVILGTS
jgi:hypothetical protein